MALVKTGNTLATALQQPGATVSNDGYGLLTSTVMWTGDDAGNPIKKGSDHPEFSFMKENSGWSEPFLIGFPASSPVHMTVEVSRPYPSLLTVAPGCWRAVAKVLPVLTSAICD